MTAHVANDILVELAPVARGITLISCPSQYVREVESMVIQEACTAGSNLGPAWPVSKAVTVLVSGTARQVQYAKALHACSAPCPTAIPVTFRSAGSRKNFDFLSQEGMCYLQPHLEPGSGDDAIFVLTQPVEDEFSAAKVVALSSLRTQACTINGSVVLVVPYEEERNEEQLSQLEDLCDEFFYVEQCESDPDQQIALSIECFGLRGLHHFGVGKVMCKIAFGPDGRIRRTYSPFIAKGLVDRAVRILRGADKTMAQIGEVVGLNKSNVSRRLSGWQPVRIDISDQWVDALKAHLDATPDAKDDPANSKGKPWTGDDEEDDEVEDDS